ncbi:MAG: hypothetical protein ACAI35_27665 [Candidatus Methylacidiphilales bacterium]
MLIVLDDSIIEEIHSLNGNEWSALSHLAVAHRQGDHLLLASRHLSKMLAQHPNLNPRDRSIYQLIESKFTDLSRSQQCVNTYANITRDTTIEKISSKNKNIVKLPLTYFSSSKSTKPSSLLAENLIDCKLIAEIARSYARSLVNGGLNVSFNMIPGGGSTTADILEEALTVNEGLLLICVDSDRKSPLSSLGATALNTKRVFDKYTRPTSELHILNARELENILPDEFYINTFGNTTGLKETVNVITAFYANDLQTARLYIDIKEGLTLNALQIEFNKCTDYKIVWVPVEEAISRNKFPIALHCNPCQKQIKPVTSTCTCIVTGPNPHKILSKALISFQRHGKQMINSMPSSQLKQVLLNFGQLVLDWGFSSRGISG